MNAALAGVLNVRLVVELLDDSLPGGQAQGMNCEDEGVPAGCWATIGLLEVDVDDAGGLVVRVEHMLDREVAVLLSQGRQRAVKCSSTSSSAGISIEGSESLAPMSLSASTARQIGQYQSVEVLNEPASFIHFK